MTDDLINNLFSDLDEFYPGSKRKRKTKVEQEPTETNLSWDRNPKLRTLPNGKDVEMFTIGALATALGRPIITLRVWIKDGHIPQAPYRLPDKKNKYGGTHKGHRVYSRAMVESAIELFAQAGALHVKRVDWSKNQQLSDKIADAWNKIRAEENK